MNNQITYDIEGASKYLNVHSNTLQEMAAKGEIPAAKIGRGWVFLESELRKWLRKEIQEQTKRRKEEMTAKNRPAITVIPSEPVKRSNSRRNPKPALPDLPQFISQV